MSYPVNLAYLNNLDHVSFRTTEDGIAVVSLNRPKYRNSIARTTVFELDAVLTHLGNDDNVKVIILRAEGDHFSSGHDLGTPARKTDETFNRVWDQGVRGMYEICSVNDVEAILRMRQVPKPIICAAKGYIIFHGTAIVAACDMVIAADDLKMMPAMLQATMGPYDYSLNTRKYREVLMTKRFVLADEAEALGLVNRVVPADKLDEECLRCARVMAKADPFQLRMIKASCNGAQDAAGFTAHVRSALSIWVTNRAAANDPASTQEYNAVQSGAVKALAPIPSAEKPDLMYWSKTAVPNSGRPRIGRL